MAPEYSLEGSRLKSRQTIFDEMERMLGLSAGEIPNLDWLDDLLCGGVYDGLPDTGVIVRWIDADVSRKHLGVELFNQLHSLMQDNRNVDLRLE